MTLDQTSRIVDAGNVCIDGHTIVHVGALADGLPDQCKGWPAISTEGTIFPGLVDLHNHFAYNIRELWRIPRRFENRAEWQGTSDYRTQVSAPCKAIAANAVTAKALVRFVEAKAVIGGTTTGQGIRSRINGKDSYFNGVMRNVELPNDEDLSAAMTRIPDLQTDEDFAEFKRSLKDYQAVFYHLCEGIDPGSRAPFEQLKVRDLIQPPLVGIHALALSESDFKLMAARGAKVIWSPLSNFLLYGSTLSVAALLNSGVDVALGCDWSPSGSKNLLFEMKVARHLLKAHGTYDAENVVRMATGIPARMANWASHVGSLERRKRADLIVLAGNSAASPYEQLVSARDDDISLVVIDGEPVFGLTAWMKQVPGIQDLESFPDSKAAKSLNVRVPGSGIENIGLAEARRTLSDAMADVSALAAREIDALLSLDVMQRQMMESFQVVLDNEHDDSKVGYYESLLPLRDSSISLSLDSILVDDGDLGRIDSQPNLPQALKSYLRGCYA